MEVGTWMFGLVKRDVANVALCENSGFFGNHGRWVRDSLQVTKEDRSRWKDLE